MEYHHIVEQGGNGETVPSQSLHSTQNTVPLPKLIHEEVSAESSRNVLGFGQKMTRRSSLKGKSWDEKFQDGLDILRETGTLL
jgi:hypothetical protein